MTELIKNKEECPNCKASTNGDCGQHITTISGKEFTVPIVYSPQKRQFIMTDEEVKELRDFLLKNGYISYEFHLPVIQLLKRIESYLGEE